MGQKTIGRTLITVGFGILVLLFAWEVFAADESLRIVEVRRNIPLADNDPVYRDYYINAGLDQGLKPNQVVTAVRKVNAKDAAGTISFGELTVPVGQLKIIFAQDRLAVAREYKLLSRDDLPMLEQMGILIGDQIDLKGSFIDNRKSSAKTNAQKEKATQTPEIRTDLSVPAPSASASVNEAKPSTETSSSTAPAGEPWAAEKPKALPEVTRENASIPAPQVAKAETDHAKEDVAAKHE